MEVTRNEMVKRNNIRSQDSLGFVLGDRFEVASTSRTARAGEAFAYKFDGLPAGRSDLQFDSSLYHVFKIIFSTRAAVDIICRFLQSLLRIPDTVSFGTYCI